ncbi:hypothetical protein J2T08_002631 [Neorhizobium galegae]|uniref:DUF2218 domain-containing protein n=1 Tax=Neorhizobium galegae TaxID=399 RepID=UPI001AEA64D9|nr:DUF2218 domain-containing protein [Neorhizobium galegae]MBP2561711.1 hypothetical protein [Neorhizobium galegae]MDQ0134713.1 hypothetical protein [Neorhizobium galegae]
MLQATAEWHTEHGGKYLVQLCKHFAHKIDVSYSETHGECRFTCGTAILDAGDGGLKILATAADEERLAETESVIERHLVRFAFRENLEVLQWQRADRAA